MIDIMTQLNNIHFSASEKKVVDFIIEHPDEILQMNVKDLKDKCYVSIATIYRLCKKLNLSGYTDLKVKISHSLNSHIKETQEFNYDFPIKKYQTHYQIIQKLKEDYENTILSTSHLFNLEVLNNVVHLMKKAQYIDIYTSSANVYFAQNFKFQMQEIGIHINVFIEEYQQRLLAAQSDKNHLAFIISFGGRGLIINEIAKILNNRNVPIILISSYNAQLHIKHKYNIHICPYENHYNKISSYSTRLSILYILDILYTCYFELDYENNLKKKLEYYSCMKT